MTTPPAAPRHPKAGGFFIAMGTIAGTLIGGHFNQPVIGLLVGLGAGILISIALWRMG